MNLLETTTHSFVIKIWLEETADEAGRGRWRGRITHVGSRKHCYFEELVDIPRFVSPFVEEMEHGPSLRRLWRKLRFYFPGR
ncbi:MAG: hypothetical protein R3272_15485 [Candidatus Promineifilaceae bacterium]|nr:hypothetical protein [Candidatus Promineifilaceae bacterium]